MTTTTYGVTTSGFVRKHLAVVVEELEDAIRDAFGNRDLRFDSKSFLGRIVGCVSQPMAELWEVAEAVFNSFYPSTAIGTALDGCLELVGLTRQPATSSRVALVLAGALGTSIPAASIFATEQDTNSTVSTVFQFATEDAVIIGLDACVWTKISQLLDPSPGGVGVSVDVNGNTYTVTSTAGDTRAHIAGELGALIEAGEGLDYSVDGDNLLLGDGTIEYALTNIWGLGILQAGALAYALSVDTGEIIAYANTLTTISTPVSGLELVWNPADAVLGRAEETDAEARQRRETSLAAPGATTVAAIRAALGDLAGVTRVAVYSNRTDAVDSDGFAAHSIAAVVTGGEAEEIAQVLWETVGAGDAMNGTTTCTVEDSEGVTQTMRWYRPTDTAMWVRVTYYLESEEDFPTDGADLIVATVLEVGEAFLPDTNVNPQRFMGPIFDAVSGISRMLVEVALDSGGSPGAYTSLPYPIGKLAVATFAAAHVTVVAG